MNQRIRKVVDELKERRRIHSDADCARIIGIEKADFSRMVNGRRPVSQRLVDNLLAEFPEICAEWLRTGEGEMFDSNPSPLEDPRGDYGEASPLSILIKELAAQRRLTEKVLDQNSMILEQNSELIAEIRGKSNKDV